METDAKNYPPRFSAMQAPIGPNQGVIVDLSRFGDALTQGEDISPYMTADEEAKIVSYVKAMTEMSYSKISKRYDHWAEADRAHDVYVPPDATAFREKAVIADTRAIADTVLTYLMAALGGRNPMFQLEGLNRKSRQPSLIMERILHQNMRRSAGEARLAQMLLDSIRYGLAPTKIAWSVAGNSNHIVNFDPRRCFPDPRVNWGDWDNAQFFVFADFFSFDALVKTGLYPKLKMYPQLRNYTSTPRTGWTAHMNRKEEGRGLAIDLSIENARHSGSTSEFKLGSARIIDEAWVSMAGYQLGMPSIESIYLLITVMDEDVVIRFQLNPYGRQFPIVMSSLHNDVHKAFGQSLYDLLLPMHDIGTFLLRSRIDNISATLNNLIFADPTMVSIPDLIDRNPWGIVRMLPGAKPQDGVFIADIPDVTRGHFQDIAMMSDLKQRVSAASDAQQGMPTSDGIRTATEIQRLSQLGSQRLGVLARIISATALRPAVRMMVANIQDALSGSGSIRVDQKGLPTELQSMVQDGYLDYDVAKDVQGDIDYLVVDGTLPIEPTRNAETWMNMLQIMDRTGLNMEYDTGRIAEEAIRSLGVTDIDQFRIPREVLQQQGMSPSQQMSLMSKMQGATVKPVDDLEREVQKGNLIPMRQSRAANG